MAVKGESTEDIASWSKGIGEGIGGLTGLRPIWPIAAVIGIIFIGSLVLMFPVLLFGQPPGNNSVVNTLWTEGFTEALSNGDPYPRWNFLGYGGAGSPAFFFFGPLSYYVAAIIRLALCPACQSAQQVGIAFWFFVFCSGIGAYCLARRYANWRASTVAALAYMALPYHQFIDVWFRADLAEVAAYVFVPVCLRLGSQVGRSRFSEAWLSLFYALLILTHLPSALIASPAIALHALLAGGATLFRRMVRCGAALAIGIALAGLYLWPALRTLHLVHSETWWSDYYRFDRHFLSFGPTFLYVALALITTVLVGLGIIVGWRGGGDNKSLVAYLIIVVGAWFLMTPISMPVWEALPILQKIQFPWRLLLLIDVAVIPATAIIAAPAIRKLGLIKIARWIFAVIWVAVICVLLIPMLVSPFGLGPGAQVYFDRRAEVTHQVDQKIDRPDCYPSGVVIDDNMLANGFRPSGSLPGELRRSGQGFVAEFSVDGPKSVTLPIFYYPIWQLVLDGELIAMRPTKPLGLIEFDVGNGRHSLEVRRVRLPEERWGGIVSLFGLGGLIVWIAGSLRYRRRSVP